MLLNRGVNVLLADLALRPEAEELVEAHSQGSPRALYLKTDVTIWTDLSHMFEIAHQSFGSIDIVCPGAGIYEPHFSNFWRPPGKPPSRDDPKGDRYACLDINITHPIRVTQLAISYFLSAKPKVSTSNPKTIIHISSVAGQTVSLVKPVYHASKHAINGFVRSLAKLESTLGIRVAAVAPNVIKTPLWTSEHLAFVLGGDTWILPEEVAAVMVALIEKTEITSRSGENADLIQLRGGSIIEVNKGGLRDVQQYNDPGPSGPAQTSASGLKELEDETFGLLNVEDWGKAS